jgi:hypothetical protein
LIQEAKYKKETYTHSKQLNDALYRYENRNTNDEYIDEVVAPPSNTDSTDNIETEPTEPTPVPNLPIAAHSEMNE